MTNASTLLLGSPLLVDDQPLLHPEKFVGYRGHPKAPDRVVLRNNGLHVELVFDRTHMIGSRDQAGLADVRLESAISAIMDCEDSVAAVDAEDKVQVYANWLGLMRGDLSESFEKGGSTLTRSLNPDREFVGLEGQPLAWVSAERLEDYRFPAANVPIVAAVREYLATV